MIEKPNSQDIRILRALNGVYQAFYDLPGKTEEQFASMHAACRILSQYGEAKPRKKKP